MQRPCAVSKYIAPAGEQYDLPAQLPLRLISVVDRDWAGEVDGGVCAPRGFSAQGPP